MNLIPTSATAAEKLKRLAKKQRKSSGTSLAVALDAVAIEHGYTSWKHVTECVQRYPTTPTPHGLPPLLGDFLAGELRDDPPAYEVLQAFRSGLVFAMDAKDADNSRHEDDVEPCDDDWALAAGDIWRVFIHARDHEADPALIEQLDPQELLQFVQEDLMNYRLFRYTGWPTPQTLDAAFERVLRRYFFPPTFVWLAGKFIDMSEVAEVRVDGEVVFSSNASSAAPSNVNVVAADIARPAHILPSPDGMICRLDISKMEPGLYEYRLSYHGQEMVSDAGFQSIRDAIQSASAITGDIRGFEVAYAGVTVGTYPLEHLQSSAEQIARQAVATLGSLNGP